MKYHFGSKIKKIANEKDIPIKLISSELGLTKAGVYEIFKRKDINTDQLRKISILFKVTMSYWFDEEENKIGNYYYLGNDECANKLLQATQLIESLEDKIKIKDELILSKDELIASKEKMIRTLEDKK